MGLTNRVFAAETEKDLSLLRRVMCIHIVPPFAGYAASGALHSCAAARQAAGVPFVAQGNFLDKNAEPGYFL